MAECMADLHDNCCQFSPKKVAVAEYQNPTPPYWASSSGIPKPRNREYICFMVHTCVHVVSIGVLICWSPLLILPMVGHVSNLAVSCGNELSAMSSVFSFVGNYSYLLICYEPLSPSSAIVPIL